MKDLPPGTTIGPYVIRGVAGRGAVGVVYLAEDPADGRQVAIKTLNPDHAGETILQQRFIREAQGVAAVQHPNIITVLDSGDHAGLPYLVMTYVSGPDLERVLGDRGGRIDPAEVVLVGTAVADALDTAGGAGSAHRDVKPANILLEGWEPERYGGRRGRPHVYLTDFGLVKSSAQVTVTRTGTFVGTLLYMSPEQIRSRAVPASDQYSLACVLWEALTGTYPFTPTGNSMLSLLNAHLEHPVPRISERPGGLWRPELDRVFATALAKTPEDRFDSCGDFVNALTSALRLGSGRPPVTPAPPHAAAAIQPATPDADEPPPPLFGAVPVGQVGSVPAATSPSASRRGSPTGLLALVAALLIIAGAVGLILLLTN